jgi:membrane-bound transcription factor site-1 protease
VSPGGWNYTGVASGNITFHVESPPQYGTKSVQMSVVSLPLRVNIIPTPPREKRVLWDVLHSIKYPPGYVPRDNLDIKVRGACGISSSSSSCRGMQRCVLCV